MAHPRFVDPPVEYLFVDDPEEVPLDATPFDLRGVELSHRGGDCSFETFLRHYDLDVFCPESGGAAIYEDAD